MISFLLNMALRIINSGQFENQERAMNKLMIIGPAAVGLILLLLFVTFRSIRLSPLVVFNLMAFDMS